MKPEYAKSTKARFLAEFKRHIEQMIQTINRAPIYSRKLSKERFMSLYSDQIIFVQIRGQYMKL